MAQSRENISAKDAANLLQSFLAFHPDIANYLPHSLAYFIAENRYSPSSLILESQTETPVEENDLEILDVYNRFTHFFSGHNALSPTPENCQFAKETLIHISTVLDETQENIKEDIFSVILETPLSYQHVSAFKQTQSFQSLQHAIHKSIEEQAHMSRAPITRPHYTNNHIACNTFNRLINDLQVYIKDNIEYTQDIFFATTVLKKLQEAMPHVSLDKMKEIDIESQQKIAHAFELSIQEINALRSKPSSAILTRLLRDNRYKHNQKRILNALSDFNHLIEIGNLNSTEDFLSEMSDVIASTLIKEFIFSLNDFYKLEAEALINDEPRDETPEDIKYYPSLPLHLHTDVNRDFLFKPAARSPSPVQSAPPQDAEASSNASHSFKANIIDSSELDNEQLNPTTPLSKIPFFSLADDMAEDHVVDNANASASAFSTPLTIVSAEKLDEEKIEPIQTFSNPLLNYMNAVQHRRFSPELETLDSLESNSPAQASAAPAPPASVSQQPTNPARTPFFLQELKDRLVAFGMYFSSQIDANEANKLLADKRSWRKFFLKPITYWYKKVDVAAENRAKEFVHHIIAIPARSLSEKEERLAIETLRKLFNNFVDLLPLANDAEPITFDNMTRGLVSESTAQLKIACTQIAHFFHTLYSNVFPEHLMLDQIDDFLLQAASVDDALSDAEQFQLLHSHLQAFLQKTEFEITTRISAQHTFMIDMSPNEKKRQIAIDTYLTAANECKLLNLSENPHLIALKDSIEKIILIDFKNRIYGTPLLPLLLGEMQEQIDQLTPILLNAFREKKVAESLAHTGTVKNLYNASRYVASFFYKQTPTIEKPDMQEQRLNHLGDSLSSIQERASPPSRLP